MNNERGSILITLALILVVLSAAVDMAVVNFDTSLRVIQAYNSKKHAFYMAEGVRAITTNLMQSYLMTVPMPVASDIETYVNSNLPPLIPAPYTISPVTVEVLKFTQNAIIPTGPFKGMNGPVTDLRIRFTLQAPSPVFTGNIVENMDLRISFAYIAMFQFMVFYDTGMAWVQTGPDLELNGRLHANSDLCIGGNGGWQSVLKATVGGRLINIADAARCGAGWGTGNVRFATSPSFTTFADMRTNYDNGCTNCNGSGLNWDAFALARWNEQVLDQVHGVQILKLPGAGAGQVQLQAAGNTEVLNNTNNLRFIVDPVLPADSAAVKSYKFAYNADIRIINGVWYIKDFTNANNWPGLPIWSDHPGRYTENGIPVGQEDIRDRWATSLPWPASPATPRGYSYYEYDADAQTIVDDPVGEGVISYGTLYNSGAGSTPFKPGYWVSNGNNSVCDRGPIVCNGGCNFASVWIANPSRCPAGESAPNSATLLLIGTRGGFRNGHINEMAPGTAAERAARSRILPVNFDVQQFQTMLANTNPGELGSYFGVTGYKRSPFNGIVFITSTWPNSDAGYGTGGPAPHPFQGAQNDANQIAPTHSATQRALPQPLCSNSPALLPPLSPGLAGQPFDFQGTALAPEVRFRIPDCASYVTGGIEAFPNAVRVVNGATLNAGVLPKGLSIVTNLPLYMTGDYNTGSNVTTATSTPWLPSLLAGDKVAFVSNAWTDRLSRWDQAPSATNRLASNTTYNTAMLTEPAYTLSLFLENWTGRNMRMNGSMVIGHNAVYALHDNYCCGTLTYDPPNRFFNYDQHFNAMINQPPGTPVFPISAIAVWSKTE